MTALILTLLVPGLGQLYYGKNGRGILMILLGITPLYLLVLIWSLIDVVMLNNSGAVPVYKPKDALWAIVILIFIVPTFLFIAICGVVSAGEWYSNHYVFPEQTRHEIHQITQSLMEYHSEFGRYPDSIGAIVKGNPIRTGWYCDSWGNPYHYSISDDGKYCTLISMGQDRTLNTGDDIQLSNH